MTRDALDRGSQVVIHLPHGKTYADTVLVKAKIASGLDVKESQVYFTADLRVWMLVMEEFQMYFEDQKKNKEIANLLARIQALGPAAGVIVLSSSQKPSGVGAGDVQRLFNGTGTTTSCGSRCGAVTATCPWRSWGPSRTARVTTQARCRSARSSGESASCTACGTTRRPCGRTSRTVRTPR
jgi:hypothetical protein